jgi:hypothetical protein
MVHRDPQFDSELGVSRSLLEASGGTNQESGTWGDEMQCTINYPTSLPKGVQTSETGNASLAYPIALGISNSLRDRGFGDEFDCIVPVPLSPEKARNGEIHRTKLLANELSRLDKVPVKEVLSLTGTISKRSMINAGHTYYQFERRYAALLEASDELQSLSRILLVDDVLTRGGTLKVIAKEIWRLNPEAEVIVATGMQMVLKSVVRDTSGLLV